MYDEEKSKFDDNLIRRSHEMRNIEERMTIVYKKNNQQTSVP